MMHPRHTRRRGFTLVELLAVSAAVSLLGTQLFDAILQTREGARRTQCQNNLKMIGLALHNYHDAFGRLPPGWIGADSNPQQPNVFGLNGWGWQTMMSPFLDEAVLFNKLNFTDSVTDEKHAEAIKKPIATLRCPSDPFNKKTWTLKDTDGKDLTPVATTNYAGSFGTSDFSKCEKMKPGENCEGDGAFYLNSSLNMQAVEDGTSNTIAVGERATLEKLDRMTTWSGVFPKAKSPFARTLGTSDQALDAKDLKSSGYGSGHKGMIQFLFLDGSVHPLETKSEFKVFQSLTTRSGGEQIAE